MSYNDLIYRDLESSLLLKKKLLETYSRNSNDRKGLKQKILNTEEYEAYLKDKNISFSRLNQLSVEEMSFVKEQIDFNQMKISIEHSLVKNKINSYNSELDSKKLTVQGKLKELRSKLSILKSKGATQRFLIREEFLNYFNINNMRTNKSSLNVSTESEVLTLPIAEESFVAVNKIFISNESNCIPGDFKEGKNKYIYSTIDGNESTVFEAHKEGEGPLVLDLTFQFKRETVVNEITIGQLPGRGSSSIEIEDVYYSDENNRTYSLKKLINTDFQNLSLLKASDKRDLKIKHLPINAYQAKVVLKVKEFSKIDNLEVFSIGLKKVLFNSIKYKNVGEINSNTFNIPESYFEVSYKENSIPKNKNTFKSKIDISLDNGGTYSSLKEDSLLITDGKEKQLVYKYKLERDVNALNKINEILDDSYFVDIEAETSLVNKSISPSRYSLPFENILRDSLRVVQNKVLSRSDSLSRRVVLGKIKNQGLNTFESGISLKEYEGEEISLFLNKEKLTRVYAESELIDGNLWLLTKDEKTIKVFTNKSQPLLEVSILIKPSLPVIEKKPEGYYVSIKEAFDYDKNTLKLTCVTSMSTNIEETIPSGKSVFFLNNSYIDANSIRIEFYQDQNWSELSWQNNDNIEINTLDGIIKFSEENLLSNEKRINYKYFKTKILEKNEFEIWVKDNQVKGLYIHPESISFDEKVDVLGGNNSERYYLFDGSYSSARADISSNRSFILSNSNIIKGSLSVSKNLFEDFEFKEVDYIDGLSEFLNIEKMQKDIVPSLEKDTEGKVQFSLQEVPYTSGVFSSEIKVYNSKGEIVASANPEVEGRVITISLEEDTALSTGYYLSYYYQLEVDEYKKYSVNYLDGILYTSEDVSTSSPEKTVSYKIGRLGVEYYIYNEIKNFEVNYENSTVEVRTEEFLETNSNIKFLGFSSKDKISLEGLEEYYSPIIYSLEVGLN